MADLTPNPRIEEIFQQRKQYERQLKIKRYRELNAHARKGQTLFTGSSLMEQFPVDELCRSFQIDTCVYNRGVGGFTTDDFLREIDTQLLDLEPSKIFINIGTNDIKNDPAIPEGWMAHLITNYTEILRRLRERLPDSTLYLMAYYPVNPDAAVAREGWSAQALKVRTNEAIAQANREVEKLAQAFSGTFINANKGLTDEQGRLKEAFTIDGIHMYPDAYAVVLENLRPYLA